MIDLKGLVQLLRPENNGTRYRLNCLTLGSLFGLLTWFLFVLLVKGDFCYAESIMTERLPLGQGATEFRTVGGPAMRVLLVKQRRF